MAGALRCLRDYLFFDVVASRNDIVERRDQMSIEFEAPKPITQMQVMLKTVAEEMMRPRSRYFDEHEHEIPWDYIEFMHMAMKAAGVSSLAPQEKLSRQPSREDASHAAQSWQSQQSGSPEGNGTNGKRPPIGYQMI